ncbi:hypothetical protein L218DRAFT_961856 [Marasmius fiardii PR-910]|nr:hypothetical protein L218DRAFT_961856 [Marasmius fiardii PR-910]
MKSHGYVQLRLHISFYFFSTGGFVLSTVVGASPVAMKEHCFPESTSGTPVDIIIRSQSTSSIIEAPQPEVKTASQSLSGGTSQSPNVDTTNQTSNQQLQSDEDDRPDPTSASGVVPSSSTTSSVKTGTVSSLPTTAMGSLGNSNNDLVVIGAIKASFCIGIRGKYTHPTPPINTQGKSLVASYSDTYHPSCEHWPSYILLAFICATLLLRWLFKSPQIELPKIPSLRCLWPRHQTPTV